MMDLARFEDGLDRHGADLAAWPVALQASAQACLEASEPARAARDRLLVVEAYLRTSRPAATGADAMAVGAMAARAMRRPQAKPAALTMRRGAWIGAGVLALLLGVLVGTIGPDHEVGSDHVVALAFDPATFDPLAAIDVD